MSIGLVGKKCGMTRIFTDAGESVVSLGQVISAAGEHRVVYNGHLDLAR